MEMEMEMDDRKKFRVNFDHNIDYGIVVTSESAEGAAIYYLTRCLVFSGCDLLHLMQKVRVWDDEGNTYVFQLELTMLERRP